MPRILTPCPNCGVALNVTEPLTLRSAFAFGLLSCPQCAAPLRAELGGRGEVRVLGADASGVRVPMIEARPLSVTDAEVDLIRQALKLALESLQSAQPRAGRAAEAAMLPYRLMLMALPRSGGVLSAAQRRDLATQLYFIVLTLRPFEADAGMPTFSQFTSDSGPDFAPRLIALTLKLIAPPKAASALA